MSVSESRCWAGLEFQVAAADEELAGWVMMQNCGASACEIKPGDEGCVLVQASFERESLSKQDIEQIANILIEHGVVKNAAQLRSYRVPQEDWLAKWKEGFKPFAIGERLLICPVWEQEAAATTAAGRKLLLIEPGMAFGTGLHATTRFCLRSVERDQLGPAILDVGTGSGILAIAAALLDDSLDLTACDDDPVAVAVAHENCRLNGVEEKIKLLTGSTEAIADKKFDDILSNLTCEVIVSLLPEYRRLLKPGGSVVCAGVLLEKLDLLESAAVENGFEVVRREPEGIWCGVILRWPG